MDAATKAKLDSLYAERKAGIDTARDSKLLINSTRAQLAWTFFWVFLLGSALLSVPCFLLVMAVTTHR